MRGKLNTPKLQQISLAYKEKDLEVEIAARRELVDNVVFKNRLKCLSSADKPGQAKQGGFSELDKLIILSWKEVEHLQGQLKDNKFQIALTGATEQTIESFKDQRSLIYAKKHNTLRAGITRVDTAVMAAINNGAERTFVFHRNAIQKRLQITDLSEGELQEGWDSLVMAKQEQDQAAKLVALKAGAPNIEAATKSNQAMLDDFQKMVDDDLVDMFEGEESVLPTIPPRQQVKTPPVDEVESTWGSWVDGATAALGSLFIATPDEDYDIRV